MTKNISVTDALAVLVDSGFTFGEEHAEMIQTLVNETYRAQIQTILAGDEKHTGKLIEESTFTADEWADRLLAWSEDFANEFVGEVKNVQGGATRMVRLIGVDTPAGHLKIELRSE